MASPYSFAQKIIDRTRWRYCAHRCKADRNAGDKNKRLPFTRSMTLKSDEVADIPTPNGPMRTYVFRPVATGRYPGLVLFSEIFQVTAPIRRTAALLAGHGFVVAVPEVYHELEPAGTVLPYDAAGGRTGQRTQRSPRELASYDADARAALDFLKAHPACTGDLGRFRHVLGRPPSPPCRHVPGGGRQACASTRPTFISAA